MCIRDRLIAWGGFSLRFYNGFNARTLSTEMEITSEYSMLFNTKLEKYRSNSPVPVSYTHLDVYKRQDMGTAHGTL